MAGDIMERLRRGIIETANAIGANPLDLATAISYETAGTFDPMKRGPTTQWGQHRGLIQFGEPQARQHGVDWNDPLGSQLGPNGAIANYFRSSGFKPGMSGLDLYSTINAGAPGRYGASDANNGGAPGNVRDKWERQMADHRAKAQRLLGEQGGALAAQFASSAPAPARAGPQAPGTPAPAMGPGRSIGDAPVMAAGSNMPSPQAVFGDLIAPQAPQSFANVIDNYAQRRRAEEEEHAARQARLAALFDMFPA